ncbi:Phosphatidylserine decarboxylase proenzyme 3 [Golovinomyces cichoracearum]|uniref:Phosphatidylserine decarboxylase proenzyme 2 n=1 Tax=Golovinomyces cichoracearum TaxID=62708 RepID=A0A420J0A8_9PEZI|nr:Phosphatidylserine decarboxylase proenzyme 3 [Golovinomyces cichoracearum]
MIRSRISSRLKPFYNGSDASILPREISPSPSRKMELDTKNTLPKEANGLVLRILAIKARNLAARDKNGTSDPYLVLSLGDSKHSTHSISKTINPSWNVSMQIPVSGTNCSVLYCVCWDKDRFGKDYMGEFDLSLDDLFSGDQTELEPKWYTLRNERTCGKKNDKVSGDVQLQLTLYDSTNLNATPAQILEKFRTISSLVYLSDNSPPSNKPSASDVQVSDDIDDEQSGESDATTKSGTTEKRRRKLMLRTLRKKKNMTGYEFSGNGEVVGIVFLEICKITDLPPERNVTRTSFDMDPFVIASLGKKTHRTRVIRHNLNPVFDEKMIFQVLRHEQTYSFSFSVVDRDKLSGNDFVASAFLPLKEITITAPEANPETGLYTLTSPGTVNTPPIKSRYRNPLSRSSSSQDLSKRPHSRNSSTNTFQVRSYSSNFYSSSSKANISSTKTSSSCALQDDPPIISNNDENGSVESDFHSFTIPLKLKNAEKWDEKHSPLLFVRAKYLPYPALRQQFWRSMLRQYDSDETSSVSKVELTTMLDTLGSTLKESTIDSWFGRFHQTNGDEATSNLTFDEAVICLEDQLMKNSNSLSLADRLKALIPEEPTTIVPSIAEIRISDCNDNNSAERMNNAANDSSTSSPQIEEGDFTDRGDLNDRCEEHVVEIRECPICHQPRLNKRSDTDIVTHIATCASQDWQQVNKIVMSGFVTSTQAQRKWYSKVITKISYGGYKLGANSANILVQDRITGHINEERMSVYVRLGIRLLYKGLKSKEMEKKRSIKSQYFSFATLTSLVRRLLRSLSQKQGIKYDDPASRSDIPKFIAFHQLDMSEVLTPVESFKNFNEFFYRKLKDGARPCSAPDNPGIIVSPADCRSIVFNRMDDATRIWVKGREFTVERILGNAYPEDAIKYKNGALGIFRLAPQDYHRFHIPVDGILEQPKVIEGEYYTVNPMAIRSTLDVYGENVRVIIPINSTCHGRVMVICVGAMMVGSTVITREAGEQVKRAEELGYFKFGGSTILLMFQEGVMQFDEDLIENSNIALETLVRVGMSIGHTPSQSQYISDMRKKADDITEKEIENAKRRI